MGGDVTLEVWDGEGRLEMWRLLLLTTFVKSASGNCLFLHCPAIQISQPVACNNCSSCAHQTSSFCVSLRNQTCGCIPSIPMNCQMKSAAGLEMTSFCSTHGSTTLLPSPQVRPQGSKAISIIVPRFFSKPPFDTLSPSNLVLLVRFRTKEPCSCRDYYSIEAQRRSDTECLLRIKLAMPGIDHKTDDHYYYDDMSALESELSTELFESAESIEAWTEVTIERQQKITGDSLHFYAISRSNIVNYHLVPPTAAEHHLRGGGNQTEGALVANSTV